MFSNRSQGLRRPKGRTTRFAVVAALAVTAAVAVLRRRPRRARRFPPGFQESIVFSGLQNPTVVRFAPDGRVFVAEKSGLIKVFDNLTDTTPTSSPTCARKVHNFWDRGLLGLALASRLPARTPTSTSSTRTTPRSAATPPRWGTPERTLGSAVRRRPAPPPTAASSAAGSRASRPSGNVMAGTEQVLIEDWCQQYPSHSIGTLEFGPDGALYASGGDGASFNFADYGQDGNPVNPCGDPPGAPGDSADASDGRGRRAAQPGPAHAGDPVTLDGTIIRVDPATGAGLPDNPLAASADANARRIIAYGLRNPFRFTVPARHQRALGRRRRLEHVGGDQPSSPIPPTPSSRTSAGPATRATAASPATTARTSTSARTCTDSRARSTAPYYAYHHSDQVVPGETCPTGSSSIAGLAF